MVLGFKNHQLNNFYNIYFDVIPFKLLHCQKSDEKPSEKEDEKETEKVLC